MAGRRIAQGGEGGEGGVDGEVSLGHADLAARRTPGRRAWRGPPDDACPGEGFAVSSHTPQNKELPVQFAFGSFCQPPQDCAAFPVSVPGSGEPQVLQFAVSLYDIFTSS